MWGKMEVESGKTDWYASFEKHINEEKKFLEIPDKEIQPRFGYQEQQIIIDDRCINYLRVGNGPHHVMCVPGAFGSSSKQFKLQLHGFDLDKFTLIGYDTPGYAKSTPPERDYSKQDHYTDADMIHKLMKAIDVQKYSLLGWCYGGIVSLIHAAKFPEAVNKLVVSGARAYVRSEEFDFYEELKNLDANKAKKLADEGTFEQWQKHIDFMVNVYKPKNGDICSSLLQDIKCPTLILHGANDVLVDGSHVTYMESHISNSRVYIYPEGRHSLHTYYAEDFNRRVQEFLLEATND